MRPPPLHYGGNATVRTIQVYVMTAANAGAYPGGGGGGGGRTRSPSCPPPVFGFQTLPIISLYIVFIRTINLYNKGLQ